MLQRRAAAEIAGKQGAQQLAVGGRIDMGEREISLQGAQRFAADNCARQADAGAGFDQSRLLAAAGLRLHVTGLEQGVATLLHAQAAKLQGIAAGVEKHEAGRRIFVVGDQRQVFQRHRQRLALLILERHRQRRQRGGVGTGAELGLALAAEAQRRPGERDTARVLRVAEPELRRPAFKPPAAVAGEAVTRHQLRQRTLQLHAEVRIGQRAGRRAIDEPVIADRSRRRPAKTGQRAVGDGLLQAHRQRHGGGSRRIHRCQTAAVVEGGREVEAGEAGGAEQAARVAVFGDLHGRPPAQRLVDLPLHQNAAEPGGCDVGEAQSCDGNQWFFHVSSSG